MKNYIVQYNNSSDYGFFEIVGTLELAVQSAKRNCAGFWHIGKTGTDTLLAEGYGKNEF